MKSGSFGNSMLIISPQNFAAPRTSENWQSIQWCFHKFLMKMGIKGMSKNKDNG